MTRGSSSVPRREDPTAGPTGKGRRTVWLWTGLISLGGALFGFDTGVISGALLFIKQDFGLNAFEQSSVVSVLLLGAMAGAVGVGRIEDRIGRRKVLGIEGAIFLVGTAIAVFATGYPMLLVARLVLGLAVGSASATVPVYLSEISPTGIRGRALTLNQLMITVGILAAYLVNLAFAGSGNWRGMFAVGAIPALGMLLGAIWVVPESLDWLYTQGRADEVRRIISSVSTTERADQWLERRRRSAETGEQRSARTGWRVLGEERVRPALIVGLTVAAVQQFGGINTIIYYAPTVIERTGLTAANSIFYSVAIGVINLVMTIVSIRLIDRVGRRPLLIVSLSGMAVTLALLGLTFVLKQHAGLALLFMVLYIVAFAVGLGPVFWALVGEVFPADARASGSSASTAVNWLSNFILSLIFLSVADAIGQGQTFWILALVCAFGLWFVRRYVPETRNRESDEVSADLRRRFGRRAAAPSG